MPKKNLRRQFLMKLKSLYIKNYKNLINFYVNFEVGNGLTMFVGNNGSGKSNVLEAISGIFHDLFKYKFERKITCDYKLEYELNDINCKIEQKKGTLRCFGEKYKSTDSFITQNAPSNIIGLYSGEEDRLWTQFYESYYHMYIRRIKTHQHQEHMRLMFVNKYYWNVALLTLLLSNNETLAPFIKDELGINEVTKVSISFDFRHYDDMNVLLQAFIDRINPTHKARIDFTIQELKNNIFYDILSNENKNAILFGSDTRIKVDSGITDMEVFRYFTQAFMQKKEKIITDITISLNDNITVQQLSEGEKKLILVKTVLEILSDEKTIVLMDEPDAHLHEGRKSALYDLMHEYPNSQIIIATHSPIMAQLANENELVMLENETGTSTVLTDEKIEKIKRLSGTSWDVIGQGMMLKSNRPLVVFEGKTDVMYVKRALELLKQTKPSYRAIAVDFLNANGAGNVKSFIDNLNELVPEDKKIIVFFDRDDAGKDGAHAITEISKDDERIAKYKDITQGNITVSFIPYKAEITNGDFLIEDYFSWDGTIKIIMDNLIPLQKHPIKSLPNLPVKIKKELEKRFEQFKPEEFNGFTALLDKIMELSKENVR